MSKGGVEIHGTSPFPSPGQAIVDQPCALPCLNPDAASASFSTHPSQPPRIWLSAQKLQPSLDVNSATAMGLGCAGEREREDPADHVRKRKRLRFQRQKSGAQPGATTEQP